MRPLLLYGQPLIACVAHAPAWLCGQRDVLFYLAPSLALAGVIRALTRRHAIFFLFQLAGTICHELAHLLVGFITGARPGSFTVMPRRTGQGWELGAVTLKNVRWFNAAPSALAPLLLLLIPLWVAVLRTRHNWHFEWRDIGLAFLLAPQFIACWPSAPDWKIATHSLPAIIVILLTAAAMVYGLAFLPSSYSI